MISFTEGNLLEANVEALVNTVNTVGVMGKGIALMFKDAFPDNFKAYAAACKAKEIQVGRVFVTERQDWEQIKPLRPHRGGGLEISAVPLFNVCEIRTA